MSSSREQRIVRILSGDDRALSASALRGGLSIIEPFYAAAMLARNALYDANIFRAHKLPRPTISVGNITTGGTGKTPMVRWLAERLIASRLRPAVLLRGYRGEASGTSDEQRLLADALGSDADVIANPKRRAGAMTAMQQLPQPDVFILDDAFQHRRAARDFDLVLVNATEPFGFGHVLPRGLLREPLRGVARADAIVITRSNLVDASQLAVIEQRLRAHAPNIPIHHAQHVHAGLRNSDGSALPLEELSRRRFFLFCGIADPVSLQRQLECFGENFVGFRFFDDHHAYTGGDLFALEHEMAGAHADVLVTTEKDWVKLDAEVRKAVPILRLDLQIQFREGDGEKLLQQIAQKAGLRALTVPASSSASRG